MELTTAMLADAAQVADGKLYVLGGQWDRLVVGRFPAVHPTMAVVLVIRVEYTEAPQTFQLHAELTLDGQSQDVRAAGQLATGHSPGQVAGAPAFVPLVIAFTGVPFPGPGRYEWVIAADDAELGRVPLEVLAGPVPGMPPGPQVV